MPWILIVEDEPTLRDSLRRGLLEEGYEPVVAGSLHDAERALNEINVDAILLDIMLPDGTGVEFVQALRQRGEFIPVLILTARDRVEDRVVGLDGGADDYLVKPFSFDELLARLRALLRRSTRSLPRNLRVADLEVDLIDRLAQRGGVTLDLTPRQFELLVYFMQNPGKVIARADIACDVWKEPTATWTNVIEVQINHLRRKIERDTWPAILHTVRGQGYLLEVRPSCDE